MLYNETIKEHISQVDAIFISNRFCDMVNEQSCDCDELIIKNGEKLILLTVLKADEETYIGFQEINEFDKAVYVYEVDLTEEKFKFDKELFLENGQIEGIRFNFKDNYLFIFALEYNLVLTKSKYDLFDEIEMDVLDEENEAKLKIYISR